MARLRHPTTSKLPASSTRTAPRTTTPMSLSLRGSEEPCEHSTSRENTATSERSSGEHNTPSALGFTLGSPVTSRTDGFINSAFHPPSLRRANAMLGPSPSNADLHPNSLTSSESGSQGSTSYVTMISSPLRNSISTRRTNTSPPTTANPLLFQQRLTTGLLMCLER